MPTTFQTWITTIAERVGDDDRERARRTACAFVEELARALPSATAAALADELPAPLADSVLGAGRGWVSHATDDSIVAAIATRARVLRGMASEYASVVGQVLADRLSPELRARLDRQLALAWRELLAPRPGAPGVPAEAAPQAGGGRTLATGRPPQGRRPLSEGGR